MKHSFEVRAVVFGLLLAVGCATSEEDAGVDRDGVDLVETDGVGGDDVDGTIEAPVDNSVANDVVAGADQVDQPRLPVHSGHVITASASETYQPQPRGVKDSDSVYTGDETSGAEIVEQDSRPTYEAAPENDAVDGVGATGDAVEQPRLSVHDSNGVTAAGTTTTYQPRVPARDVDVAGAHASTVD